MSVEGAAAIHGKASLIDGEKCLSPGQDNLRHLTKVDIHTSDCLSMCNSHYRELFVFTMTLV